MKISNLLIALVVLFTMSCGSGDHGHDHENGDHDHATEAEDHGHSHDGDSDHLHGDEDHEQEEFTVGDGTEEQQEVEELSQKSETVTVVVPANKGVEYKVFMNENEKLNYEWSASQVIYTDFHGEPTDYETTKYFESFVIASADKMKGLFTSPFAGSHGWYWKNQSDKDITIELKIEGKYKIIGLKQ